MTVLSPEQVALALLQAQREMGVQLTREEMYGLVAIPSRESGYDTMAHNPDRSTGDNSYGLWQVNMIDQLGVNRRRALGISRDEELFDPVVSAKAAIQLVLDGRRRGNPLYAWGGYKGKSNTYNVSTQADAAARAAVDKVGGSVANGGERFLTGMRQSIYGTSSRGASPAAQSLVAWLQSQIGKPYIFGASNPEGPGFDCSGLGAAAYAKVLGIQIPALTFTMRKYGQQITDYNNLQPGDMIYTHGSQGDFGHVGYYIGNGQVIDAPHTGAVVRQSPLSDWLPRIQGANRLIDGDGRVIVGGGLTPKFRPGTQTVPISQASLMPDFTAKGLDPMFDPFAPVGAGTTNTTQRILADAKPYLLPGLGSQLEAV